MPSYQCKVCKYHNKDRAMVVGHILKEHSAYVLSEYAVRKAF